MKFGYVRVSSKDQNPDRQIRKLRSLGIEDRYIFIDKKSGKDFDRPQYQSMLLRLLCQVFGQKNTNNFLNVL